MLDCSFIFLNGIGEATERALWAKGISSWQRFLDCQDIHGISPGRKAKYDLELQAAQRQWNKQNARHFAKTLKSRDHWRLYSSFRANAAFVDIETDGLPRPQGQITLVGIYGGGTMTTLIQGESLSQPRLQKELASYDLLVTFFGSGFDVPFLKATYPDLILDQPHWDLCFAARRLGMKGGLKAIESEIGFGRPPHLEGLTGWDAVRLWNEWQRGNAASRDLLLDYNGADCQNLKPLADFLYERLAIQYGLTNRNHFKQ